MCLSPLSEISYKRLRTWLSRCSEKGTISWDVWLLDSLADGIACFSRTEGHIVLQSVLSSVGVLRVPSVFYIRSADFYLEAILLNVILTGGHCDMQEQHMQLLSFPATWSHDLTSSPRSLVSGGPQEGDLPHRQQGPVLWTSRNASGVSCLTTPTSCPQYSWLRKPLTNTPSCVLFMVPSLWYTCFVAVAQQEEASSVLLQHPEVRESSGAAGVPVSHHAGQKQDLQTLAFELIAAFFLFINSDCICHVFLCCSTVVCRKLSWQAHHIGQGQVGQQRRPWILQTVL